MHSTLVRLQNVFGFFTSVVFALAVAIGCSVVLSPQTPSATLELSNVQVVRGRPHYYSTKREEYAYIKFDLDADLTSLFNWNTKQTFLYIVASYPSSQPATIPPSESVVWDAIIPAEHAPWHPNTWIHPTDASTGKKAPRSTKQRPGRAYPADAAPGIVRLAGQKPKYQITDVSGLMAQRGNATLSLRWNVQPWVGALVWTNRRAVGRWAGLAGGEARFAFPALKGSETVKKDDLKTETGAERNRGSPA